MRIGLFGNKFTTVELLTYLVGKGVSIASIITLDSKSKRDIDIAGESHDIGEVAQDNGVEVIYVTSYTLSDLSDRERIRKANLNIGLVTGWQRIIPPEVLSFFSLGVFGWHGSFLNFPNGRGRSPLNWSIRLGADRIYHNFFQYDAGVDTGPIFDTRMFFIEPSDYISDLQKKALDHMKDSSYRLIQSCGARHDVTSMLRPQTGEVSVSFPKITPADSELFPMIHSVDHALNIIRSTSRPFSGAFINENGQKLVNWRAGKGSRPGYPRRTVIDGT